MDLTIREESTSGLAEVSRISIAFEVRQVLDVAARDGGFGGFLLEEHILDTPYTKDYDSVEGEGPASWPKRFDTSNWGLIGAYAGDDRIGSAVVAFRTKDLVMLEGREDLAVLWDIRVASGFRGKGVGSALFRSVEAWARERGCRQLKIETQNINVPACRFYAHQGCVLGGIHRFVYREFPEEVQMLWYKDLAQG